MEQASQAFDGITYGKGAAVISMLEDYVGEDAWRNGVREAHAPDCMASIVQRLSDRDAYAVVSWLASQPVPADARPAAARGALPGDAADLKCGTAPAPGAAR